MKKRSVVVLSLIFVIAVLLSSCSFHSGRSSYDLFRHSTKSRGSDPGITSSAESDQDPERTDSPVPDPGTNAPAETQPDTERTDDPLPDPGTGASDESCQDPELIVTDPSARGFGYTVFDNYAFYFWKYHQSSVESGYYFANYHYSAGEENELIRMNPNGEMTVVTRHAGYGKIALCGEDIYFSDGTSVYCAKTFRDEVNYVAEGTVLDVSPDGNHVIIMSSSNGIYGLDVFTGKTDLLIKDDPVYPAYCAATNEGILYSSGRELRIAAYNDGNEKLIYTASRTACPDNDDSMGSIKCGMYFSWYSPTENALYFEWTRPSGGTLGNYVEGPYIKANLNDGSEEILEQIPDTAQAPGLIRNSDGSYRLYSRSSIYGDQLIDGDKSGDIRILLNSGEAAEYSGDQDDGSRMSKREISVAGGRAFITVDRGVHVPEKDMGWRPYYEREYSVVIMKDLDSGTLTELYRY